MQTTGRAGWLAQSRLTRDRQTGRAGHSLMRLSISSRAKKDILAKVPRLRLCRRERGDDKSRVGFTAGHFGLADEWGVPGFSCPAWRS